MNERGSTQAPSDTKTMFAVRLVSARGVDGLVLEQVPIPRPGSDEALVRVHAAAITRGELDWPVDRLPAIPSYELSGVIAAIGSNVFDLHIGDAVWALTGFDRDGAAADYTLVPASRLAPKPHTLGHRESAAIPLGGLSAWQGLLEHGRLQTGERVLIHGAAGGVGRFATQLARWRGGYVIGTGSSSAAVEQIRALGADEVVDRTRVPLRGGHRAGGSGPRHCRRRGPRHAQRLYCAMAEDSSQWLREPPAVSEGCRRRTSSSSPAGNS